MINDERVGTTFGDYVVQDVLGRGGMGVVYRASHSVLDAAVALKLMLPELTANEDFRARFIREAELLPTIEHPNIVAVLETGEASGELFIAMELIEGVDLKRLISKEGSLTPKRALPILKQAADALDAAHEVLVVHRDVKPQNILVKPATKPDERDQVFLTDFGLIRPVAAESTTSRTGQIFGSIQYMAPEQIEGAPTDGRADVYSLACVAYECFTGKIPFERPNEIGVIWAHIHSDPPRASEATLLLPGGIDDVIRQGMAKHPDDRYLTCGELVAALEEGLKKQRRNLVPMPLRPLVRRATRPKTEREVWAPNFFPELSRVRKLTNRTNWGQVAAVFAALLLLPAAVTQLAHPQGVVGAATEVADAVAALAPDPEVTSSPPRRSGPSQKETGLEGRRPIAIRELTAEEPDAARKLRRDSKEVPRAGGRSKTMPVDVGADLAQTKVVFASWRNAGSNKSITGGEIYSMNADGTDLQRLTWTDPAQQEVYPAVSPDGTSIVFHRSSDVESGDLFIVGAEGTTTRRLTDAPGCEVLPNWSPDGKKVLFSRSPSCITTEPADVWILDVETGRETKLTSGTHDDWGGAFSPNGESIVFTRDDRLFTMRANGTNVRQVGGGVTGWDPDWCPGGDVVFARESGIWSADLKSGEKRQLSSNRAQYGDDSPSCSPNGTKVMFESFRDGHWQIYVMDIDGSDETNITRSQWGEHHPDWQPSL